MIQKILYKCVFLPGSFILFMTGSGMNSFQVNDQVKKYLSDIKIRPEPSDWFAGDIHVHRSCNGSLAIPSEELAKRMEENDLAVISVLGDMGNSQAPDRIEDLKRIDGNDAFINESNRLIHYSAEWHWDADSEENPNKAPGGHLVILGPRNASKIWDERLYKILEWGRSQGCISGFAHMQYLQDPYPQKLNCCIPIDYPVEIAFGTVDFISEDCNGGDAAIEAYYKLLNCGFRPGLAAGTDFPCNGGAAFGSLLTYVNIKDRQLTYRTWIEGIKKGNTVISRNGHNEFLELTVNDKFIPGDEIHLKEKENLNVKVKWTGIKKLVGNVELVSNGKILISKMAASGPDNPFTLEINHTFDESSWICARRMDEKGHQVHTAAVFVMINDRPLKPNARDALYFAGWIDNILDKIAPGGEWSSYYRDTRKEMINRYRHARECYMKMAEQANKSDNK